MAAVALAAAAVWVLGHPFVFRENDSQVYAFMALASRAPRTFSSDMFIRYGSQDSFSIFSPIYGWLVGQAGLAWATMGLMLTGAGLWLIGCWRLLSAVFDRTRAQVALVVMAAFHMSYGGFSALYLAEGFVTSRIFAEAFTLFALGEFARDRWARGSLALLVSAMLHPLMALAGIAVAGLSEAIKRPWLLALGGVGIVVAAGLAIAGVAPFNRLFVVMSGVWLTATQHRNGFVFVGNWTLNDWANLTSQACAVIVAAMRTEGWRRRFLIAALGTAAAGILASWIGGDLFKSTLIIQLQLWRCAWPLAWASVAAIFLILPNSREPRLWLVPALLFAALLPGQDWPAAAFALMALIGNILRRPIEDGIAKILLVGIAIAIAAYFFIFFRFFINSWAQLRPLGLSDLALVYARSWLAWLAAPVILLLIFRFRTAGLIASALLAIASLSVWDMRSAWVNYVMSGKAPVSLSAPVLWEYDAIASWMLLRAPAYVSLQQGSGLLFSPETAAAYERRVPVTAGIVPNSTWGPKELIETCEQADPILTPASLMSICSASDAPGSVVTRHPVAEAETTPFETLVAKPLICRRGNGFTVLRTRQFYAYDCARVRTAPRG